MRNCLCERKYSQLLPRHLSSILAPATIHNNHNQEKMTTWKNVETGARFIFHGSREDVMRQILKPFVCSPVFHHNMDVFVAWLSMPYWSFFFCVLDFDLIAMVDETLARYACWISSQARSDLCVIGNGVDSRASQCSQASLATSLEQKLFRSQKQLLSSACQRAHCCLTDKKSQSGFCQTHVILTKMLRKEWHAQFDKFSTFS